MAVVSRFLALMSLGMALAMAFTLSDPTSLDTLIPTRAAVAEFPMRDVGFGMAIGFFMGWLGNLRRSDLAALLLRSRALLGKAVDVLAVGALVLVVLYFV